MTVEGTEKTGGHKKRQAALADMARRAREAEVGETALDWIVDRLGSGETFRGICRASLHGLSEQSIRSELYKDFGQVEVQRAIAAARKDGASSLADKTLEVAAGIETKDDAPGARVEVDALRWLAGKYDRETFGEPKQPPVGTAAVSINFGALLLEVHRAIEAGTVEIPRPMLPAVTGKDYETITDAVQGQESPGRVQGRDEGDGQDAQHEAAVEGEGRSSDASDVRQRP